MDRTNKPAKASERIFFILLIFQFCSAKIAERFLLRDQRGTKFVLVLILRLVLDYNDEDDDANDKTKTPSIPQNGE